MPRRVTARVHIDAAALASTSSPGGDLFKYLARVNRLAFTIAVANAPSRTGSLKSSHVNAGVRKVGMWSAVGTINVTAEHAPWVHDGTTGPIRARRHRFMSLPARRGVSTRILRRTVRGQSANP